MEIGPIPWTPEFAYAAGLFATDGYISIRANGYSNMGFTSKDRELVETFVNCLALNSRVRERRRVVWGRPRVEYEISFSSVRLARWYQDIGIGPRKSLTIGALNVPDAFFFDLVRGLLDGDGSIARYTDGRGRRCFSLRFYSASERHLIWLRENLASRLGFKGSLVRIHKKSPGNAMFQLAYARAASRQIATELYASRGAPRLKRKWIRWAAELASLGG